MRPIILAFALTALGAASQAQARPDSITAIVGATIIDGNGGPPLHDGVVLIAGKRIASVSSRAEAKIPKGAKIIDATGQFLVPGFIDTNVHMSLYSRLESLARYEDRFTDIAVEGAQLQLKFGVTTVRDSYGMLKPLLEARAKINRGEVPGSRLFFAGNIVGWGGPFSLTFTGTPPVNLSLFQEQMNDAVAAGAGEELMGMTPAQLRVAINKYLDKGVDFVKYGGTSHAFYPAMLGFSEEAQKALVEEVHKRGKVAETHATSPEGLRLAVEAGVDLVQHPEMTDAPIPPELIASMVKRGVICSMLANNITGKPWTDLMKRQKARTDSIRVADSTRAAALQHPKIPPNFVDSAIAMLSEQRPTRDRTVAEISRDSTIERTLIKRRNAEALIKAGCITTSSTDNYRGEAPEFERAPKAEYNFPGIGTLMSIEGLVELGMTPSQAITAATKNGAIAMRMPDQFGTIAPGRYADLVMLNADPLADIHNIRRQTMVMKEGAPIDVQRLPLKPIFYRAVPKP
ncbi:MAG TPA: amidohydrolase family protein [Gemmatimonadaceae bacterium]|jgi:imidazolonepropionase-like amidohydrolase|nr:amidohydrolase family protein [Gemmatimonadaceae bacterium]